ncbi:hypothetical protein, partial [Pseudoalteromonas neustonica]|uniref:hypothetical protein n=1 Tax=Pseudoalteromonas neustonica TaxID=1840331 RepID=UPI001644CCE6
WAMRKVEFEARRAANNKKFAASGFVHLGKHRNVSPNYTAINEGLFTEITAPNILNFGSGVGNTAVSGVSKSALPVVNINGVVTKLTSLSILNTGYQANRIKLPPAEDGTRTYDSATGVSVTHATPAIAFASENATNKVVTDRVDMWGFEFFLREINDADPFVYDKGLIQSQATSINGVATVSDNIRPITYFAWYEGDTASRGKGVNWQTASEAQRTVIASDPENNIYFDDSTGKFYQWSPRGRSFAGVGNGDWFNVESTKSSLFFESSAKFVVAQGPSNSVIPFANTGGARYVAPTNAGNALGGITDNAIFVPVAPSPSVNNECYFLVCGTVSRLNKGAYHPSFNPLGASLFEGTNQGGSFWYGNNAPNLSSKLQCFTEISVNNSTPNSGSIGNISGRPDGRFYDAIYASGAGGVCRDMRYSAWGLKTEDFAAADLAIKSGEYRGRERITFTKIMNNTDSANAQGSGVSPAGGTAGFSLGDVVFVQGMDGQYRKRTVSSISQFTIIFTENVSRAANGLIVHQRQLAISIAGEFTHTEVIGDPASILLCDDLKDGWVGSWNPIIPAGTSQTYQLTKPQTGTPSGTGFTAVVTNDRQTWVATHGGNLGWNGITNSTTFSTAAASVIVINYYTKAKLTTDSVNSELYGGVLGLGSVFTAMDSGPNKSKTLCHSLIAKLLTHGASTDNIGQEYVSLLSNSFFPTLKKLWGANSSIGENNHVLISLGAPSNNSPAFKALNYNVADNQQGFINYAYTELKHDGTDWGDDGKIHIADNQTTMLDENGNTVLVGTARCVEPLGWIKNDK